MRCLPGILIFDRGACTDTTLGASILSKKPTFEVGFFIVGPDLNKKLQSSVTCNGDLHQEHNLKWSLFYSYYLWNFGDLFL